MRHLTSVELVDLAEGTRADSSAPHLDTCEACRQQLVELRATMSTAEAIEVPEPSPLFWDHLSARVREAVAAEGAPRRQAWADGWSWWRVSARWSAGAVAVVAIVVAVSIGVVDRRSSLPIDNNGLVDVGMLADDPSFDLMTDLTADVDWDSSGGDAGLAPHEGAAERAVAQLTEGERRELQRLLEQELRQSGA